MAGSMYTVHKENGPPTLAEAARQLGVAPENLDPAFGVQPVDPRTGDYAVLMKDGQAASPPPDKTPFANPRIGTYGPPQR